MTPRSRVYSNIIVILLSHAWCVARPPTTTSNRPALGRKARSQAITERACMRRWFCFGYVNLVQLIVSARWQRRRTGGASCRLRARNETDTHASRTNGMRCTGVDWTWPNARWGDTAVFPRVCEWWGTHEYKIIVGQHFQIVVCKSRFDRAFA